MRRRLYLGLIYWFCYAVATSANCQLGLTLSHYFANFAPNKRLIEALLSLPPENTFRTVPTLNVNNPLLILRVDFKNGQVEGEPHAVWFDSLSEQSQLVQEVREADVHVFAQYELHKTVSIEEIHKFARMDESLDVLLRSSRAVIRLETPGDRNRVLCSIRVYDASPKLDHRHPDSFSVFLPVGRLPLEVLYKHIVLPERKKYGDKAYLVEVGRLAGSPEVMLAIFAMGRQAADIMADTHQVNGAFPKDSAVYVLVTEDQMPRYRDWFGFDVLFDPKDLRIQPGQQREYVMRQSMEQFHYILSAGPLLPRIRGAR